MLAGDPQALQDYLGAAGYDCIVDTAYVVTSYDYYNVIWVKCSDRSYFITLEEGHPQSVYTPEELSAKDPWY